MPTSLNSLIGSNQLHMAHSERGRQLIESYNRRVSPPSFQATDVLLTETRNLRELLLGQALFLPDPPDVLPHQLAHVHALDASGLRTISLSTIVCIQESLPRG